MHLTLHGGLSSKNGGEKCSPLLRAVISILVCLIVSRGSSSSLPAGIVLYMLQIECGGFMLVLVYICEGLSQASFVAQAIWTPRKHISHYLSEIVSLTVRTFSRAWHHQFRATDCVAHNIIDSLWGKPRLVAEGITMGSLSRLCFYCSLGGSATEGKLSRMNYFFGIDDLLEARKKEQELLLEKIFLMMLCSVLICCLTVLVPASLRTLPLCQLPWSASLADHLAARNIISAPANSMVLSRTCCAGDR